MFGCYVGGGQIPRSGRQFNILGAKPCKPAAVGQQIELDPIDHAGVSQGDGHMLPRTLKVNGEEGQFEVFL
ncbi:hypothetical protein D1872_315830 [compost metagenome]